MKKRILALTLVTVMALSMTACGTKEPSTGVINTTTEKSAETDNKTEDTTNDVTGESETVVNNENTTASNNSDNNTEDSAGENTTTVKDEESASDESSEKTISSTKKPEQSTTKKEKETTKKKPDNNTDSDGTITYKGVEYPKTKIGPDGKKYYRYEQTTNKEYCAIGEAYLYANIDIETEFLSKKTYLEKIQWVKDFYRDIKLLGKDDNIYDPTFVSSAVVESFLDEVPETIYIMVEDYGSDVYTHSLGFYFPEGEKKILGCQYLEIKTSTINGDSIKIIYPVNEFTLWHNPEDYTDEEAWDMQYFSRDDEEPFAAIGYKFNLYPEYVPYEFGDFDNVNLSNRNVAYGSRFEDGKYYIVLDISYTKPENVHYKYFWLEETTTVKYPYYIEGNPYYVGDIVTYDGKYYICIKQSSKDIPTTHNPGIDMKLGIGYWKEYKE